MSLFRIRSSYWVSPCRKIIQALEENRCNMWAFGELNKKCHKMCRQHCTQHTGLTKSSKFMARNNGVLWGTAWLEPGGCCPDAGGFSLDIWTHTNIISQHRQNVGQKQLRSIHLPKANVAHLPCILLPPSLPSLSPYFACSVPMQQHPYNGLACPADYSIFAWKWARSPWWHRNGLAHTVSMLAYGHRGRHDCAACLCADRWWHITESRTAWQTRWQHNVVAPGYAVHGLRVHNYENTTHSIGCEFVISVSLHITGVVTFFIPNNEYRSHEPCSCELIFDLTSELGTFNWRTGFELALDDLCGLFWD